MHATAKGIIAAMLVAGLMGCNGGDDDRIAELEAEVETLEGDKAAAEAEAESLAADKQQLEESNTSLQADITVLEESNSTLTADNEALNATNEDLEAQVTASEEQVAALTENVDTLNMELDMTSDYIAMLEDQLSPPPALFDSLFPPAGQPVLFGAMFAMVGPLEGLILDMVEGDIGNLQADFDAFKTEYVNIRTNVLPDLQDMMPMEPIDNLEVAVATGDPAQIGPALGQVGAVCGDCHGTYQQRTRIAYSWPDFNDVMVTDPVQNTDVVWHTYMENMALQFNGIGHNLAQGQLDEARANFTAFEAYFTNLDNACTECHTTPRLYYVTDEIDAMVAGIGAELQNANPDPNVFGPLMGAVGQQSCGGCHNLHFPAAKTVDKWQRMADLFAP